MGSILWWDVCVCPWRRNLLLWIVTYWSNLQYQVCQVPPVLSVQWVRSSLSWMTWLFESLGPSFSFCGGPAVEPLRLTQKRNKKNPKFVKLWWKGSFIAPKNQYVMKINYYELPGSLEFNGFALSSGNWTAVCKKKQQRYISIQWFSIDLNCASKSLFPFDLNCSTALSNYLSILYLVPLHTFCTSPDWNVLYQ